MSSNIIQWRGNGVYRIANADTLNMEIVGMHSMCVSIIGECSVWKDVEDANHVILPSATYTGFIPGMFLNDGRYIFKSTGLGIVLLSLFTVKTFKKTCYTKVRE